MKCMTCSNEIQPGAKFCVHCGSTVVTTAAAATSPPVAVKAAASAAAATIATASRPAYVPQAPTAAIPPGMTTMGNTVAPGTLPSDPAMVQAPKSRLGLIAGLLALVAILGIGTFITYKMFFAKDATPAVVTSEPAKSDSGTTPSADASKDGSAATGQGSSGGSNMSAPPGGPGDAAAQAAAAADAAKAAATPGTPPTPAEAAAAKAAAAKSAAAAAKADANKAPPVGSAPSASPPVAAPAPAVQHAAPQAAAVNPPPQGDRWEQMRQAYALCDREGFFDKIACNSRVGKQYCEGYWGKVAQCPVGAYGDRAN